MYLIQAEAFEGSYWKEEGDKRGQGRGERGEERERKEERGGAPRATFGKGFGSGRTLVGGARARCSF